MLLLVMILQACAARCLAAARILLQLAERRTTPREPWPCFGDDVPEPEETCRWLDEPGQLEIARWYASESYKLPAYEPPHRRPRR